VNVRLEHIKDETINNLFMKRVVCPSAVWNVNTSREHQNDQVSTEGLPTFLGSEYNESSDFFNTNEDNVASLPN